MRHDTIGTILGTALLAVLACAGFALPLHGLELQVLDLDDLDLLIVSPPVPGETESVPTGAVVRIVSLVSPSSHVAPWRRADPVELLGSGVIIEGGRILTNARLAAHPVMVDVRRAGMKRTVRAQVEHICHPCDLALLTVDSPEFFEGVEPLGLGGLPVEGEQVRILGFPRGEESVAVVAAPASGAGMAPYAHSYENLLQVRVAADLDPGLYGGPVVSGGRLVGIAAVPIGGPQMGGQIIPAPIIRHFLVDVEDGVIDGFPDLGIEVQPAVNPALRASVGIGEEGAGALVQRVDYGSPAWGVLEPGDVLVEVAGQPVGADLTVPLGNGGRVDASHLVRSQQMGDRVSLLVLRDGNLLRKEAELREWSRLVPYLRHESWPSYFIFGGLVFQPLGLGYLQVFENVPPQFFRHIFDGNLATEDRRQVLVITGILPHPVNDSYAESEDMVVETVDGVRPRDLRHLVEIVERASGPWLVLVTEQGMRIVLDLEESRIVGPDILAMYDVLGDRSRDLWSPEGD